MTQRANLAAVCVLVLLLELTSLVPGQQCSSTYQAIPGPPGRDGRDGNDGSPAVFTHEDFLKLKEMLINEGVYCSQNSATPSPSTTVTQTVTSTQVVPSTAIHTVTTTQVDHSTVTHTVTSTQVVPSTATQTVTTTQVVHSTATHTVTTTQVVPSTATCPTPTPEVQRDCQEFNSNGCSPSGVYTIRPDSLSPFDVYCDMDTDGGGWTVWQRRQDGSVDFYRNWDNYTAGFGDLSGEFWLGLDKIKRLTNASSSELRVDLGNFNETRYAKYSSFQVGDASANYTLTISGYSGTAGDSLDYHNGRQFTTYDRDNDVWGNNCAINSKGAWWYRQCATSNLNGQYVVGEDPVYTSVHWTQYRPFKFTEMKVRPSN